MSTRAASVATSQTAKRTLVNLLFQSKYTRKGPDAHRKLDVASYSYVELRDAYLKRIQLIHPDKATSLQSQKEIKANSNDHDPAEGESYNKNEGARSKNSDWNHYDIGDECYSWNEINIKAKKKNGHDAFIELQEAWKKYDKLARSMQKGKSESEIRGVQENFTLFGVGCSFSDNNDEKNKRSKIMDQACKGWFASGELSETTTTGNEEEKMDIATGRKRVSLVDDELFVDMNNINVNPPSSFRLRTKKSLIDHLIPGSRFRSNLNKGNQ